MLVVMLVVCVDLIGQCQSGSVPPTKIFAHGQGKSGIGGCRWVLVEMSLPAAACCQKKRYVLFLVCRLNI